MYIKKGYFKKIKVSSQNLLEQYNSGLNLRQIAKKYNVSHQAISLQLIKLNYKRRIRPVIYVDFKCKQCKKMSIRKSGLREPTFCSMKCYGKSRKIPIKERMRKKAIYANRYYHEILKKKPEFKLIIKERNQRALSKKINQSN